MAVETAVNKDPYALAYRYPEFMTEKPKRRGEQFNPYYESLLANQPDPADKDMDPKSRAIRYAKKNYECFYELQHVDLIVQFLDGKAA